MSTFPQSGARGLERLIWLKYCITLKQQITFNLWLNTAKNTHYIKKANNSTRIVLFEFSWFFLSTNMILIKMVHYTKHKWLSGEMDCSIVFSIKKWSINIISSILIVFSLKYYFPIFSHAKILKLVFSQCQFLVLELWNATPLVLLGILDYSLFFYVSLNLVHTMCQYLKNDLCWLCVPVFRLHHRYKYKGIGESNASTSLTREVVGIKTRSQSRLIACSVWN